MNPNILKIIGLLIVVGLASINSAFASLILSEIFKPIRRARIKTKHAIKPPNPPWSKGKSISRTISSYKRRTIRS